MSIDQPRRMTTARRVVPLIVLIVGGLLFIVLGGRHYLSFTATEENRERLLGFVAEAGAAAPLVFIAGYAAVVALSVPGAALLTMTGGFLFGPVLGAACSVIGATLGAILVFLAARAGLFGVAARAGPWARRLEAGFRANALSYLLVLRLIPVVPFWLVNLVAGAAGLRLGVFALGTFFGVMPLSAVYASLGSGLGILIAQGRAPGLTVILEPGVLLPLLGLAAMALLPVLFRHRRARRTTPA